MGSGFNFFTNGIDKTPSTTGSWVDVDVSGDGVPSGATGVILKIVNTGTTAYRGEVRKNGSADDFTGYIVNAFMSYAFVGIDANRIFEAFIGDTAVKIYLIGYTDENIGFFTNAVDKTPSTTGSWVDVDVSGDGVPVDATGVICFFDNITSATVYQGGIRKDGSSDTYTYGKCYAYHRLTYQLCGVLNRVFEAQIENTQIKLRLNRLHEIPGDILYEWS